MIFNTGCYTCFIGAKSIPLYAKRPSGRFLSADGLKYGALCPYSCGKLSIFGEIEIVNRNIFRHKLLGLLSAKYQQNQKEKQFSSRLEKTQEFLVPISDIIRKFKVTEEYFRLSCIMLVRNEDIQYEYIADGTVGNEGVSIWTNGLQSYVDKAYIKKFWEPFWKIVDKLLERIVPLIAVAVSLVALFITEENYKLNKSQMQESRKQAIEQEKYKQLQPDQLNARRIYLYPMDSGKSSK
jgi:hypothetical protein